MIRRVRGSLVPVLALALVVMFPLVATAHHDEVVDKLDRGTTERVSVSSSGQEGDGDSGRGCGGTHFGGYQYSASDDGRFVAFPSFAGNLHPADTNGKLIQDIFVYDRKRDILDLVSAMPTGLASEVPPTVDGVKFPCAVSSHSPAISGNGRYVAFVSNLPLTEGLEAATPFDKVFVRNLRQGETELVSRTWDGGPALGSSGSTRKAEAAFETEATGVSISDNGRYVAFTSNASNIVPDACPSSGIVPGAPALPIPLGCEETYVRDREKDETVLVSRSSMGEPANYRSGHPSLSGDGNYVAFESEADNLVPDDRNHCISASLGCSDVFVHNLDTGETELVSMSRDGVTANNQSRLAATPGSQSISDDGRFVVFSSGATDLVPANALPTDGSNAYVRDRKTGRTERVSVSSTGTMLSFGTVNSISDDGRYALHDMGAPVAERLDLSHLYSGHLVHDGETGQADWVLTGETAPRGTYLVLPTIGGNARFIVGSGDDDDDVVEHDTNDVIDVFVRDVGTSYDLGIGPLGTPSSPRIDLPGRPGFTRSGIATFKDAPDDVLVPDLGAEILETKVVYRPRLDDLFVRIDVERMFGSAPLFGLIPYPVIYGLRITIGSDTYELRAAGTGGPWSSGGGVFGLFRCTATACIEVAKLSGGFGTVGEAVVASIPLRDIGLDEGGEITGLDAFAGLGTYRFGVTRILDEIES